MNNKFLGLIITLLLSLHSFGQAENRIGGQVFDTENKPVIGATVSLSKDSIMMQTFVTDSAGSFSFNDVKVGKYFISVTAIGYARLVGETINFDGLSPVKESRLVMEQESNLLKSVSVTAKKPFIEQKIDRTVMNVDALVSNTGVTALDVLENAPGVIVSSEGAISLKGKSGVIIFIDDKPAYLSGQDLANYLKSLPSSTLDKIEIMPNPPSRYDAAGNAGVINIRTKKSRTGGFNGGINLAFGQGKYSRTNNSFNFNYKNQKINVFGTASYSINNGLNDLDIFRYYYKGDGMLRSTFFQNSFIRNTSYATNLKLGLDYFLTHKTTIGILVNGIIRPSDSKTINKSVVANASGATDSLITADNKEHINWKKGSINLNYLHRYSADRELSLDVDYIKYGAQQDRFF